MAALSKMANPFDGYLSSAFNPSRRINGKPSPHYGMDIGNGNHWGRNVYAMFGGTITRIIRGRRNMQSASSGAVVLKGHSGDGLIILNPDGDQQVYIHVQTDSGLKVGDRVVTGQYLGVNDESGVQYGAHCHIGYIRNGKLVNPYYYFAARKMTPGKNTNGAKRYAKGKAPGQVSQAPSKPTPSTSGTATTAKYAATKKAILAMGYKSVAAYQSAQKKCGVKLVVDNDLGSKTYSHYMEVREFQTAANKWAGYNIRVDGDFGNASYARAANIKTRNKGGTWKSKDLTGVLTSAFTKMLGINPHNHKY